jgi:thiamine pyrophosphate-dependent acetolactate synthase large subunit-like protein
LVARENLIEKAGCSLPVLMGSSALKPMELPAPSQVDSKVSMLKKGRNWIISASGGVAINANGVLEKVRKSDAPVAVRAKATPTASAKWCWD